MKKAIIKTVASVMIVLFMTSCSYISDHNEKITSEITSGKEENTMVLTDRQTKILQSKNLPTVYEELTDSQKHDIAAIEDMLSYLEKTYNVDVEFCSFVQGSVLNDEELYAYVNGETVCVTRSYENGEYKYDDSYAEVRIKTEYEAELIRYFAEKNIKVKLFSEINSVDDAKDGVISKTDAFTYVFVCDEISEGEYREIATDFVNKIAAKIESKPCGFEFHLVSQDLYTDIGEESYRTCLSETDKTKRIICDISPNGDINMR